DFAGAQHHLDQAISLLSDRHAADYASSIKESISAVEAVVRTFSTGKTLGDGLNKLETAGLTIHPALKGAWQKMYGWTSDEPGVRHGGKDAADMDQSLAKYMLVACSAFRSKESISAVEAEVRTFSTGKTLGDGLNKLETAGLTIHPALKGAWQKMYGWTSDEPGVRHGGKDAADMDQSLAKYMLVACSAFVSYLIEEANKKELLHNATGHVESGNQAGA